MGPCSLLGEMSYTQFTGSMHVILQIRLGTCLAEVCSPADPGENGTEDESSSLLWVGSQRRSAEKTSDIIKAALYAVQVFYSFFIM
jgi:hypothetical protein